MTPTDQTPPVPDPSLAEAPGNGGDAPPDAAPGPSPVVLVTGPSGAGRASAIRALEDLGFEAIDNLPLSLIPRLLEGPPRPARLALGVDTRNRDYSAAGFLDLVDSGRPPGFEVLYLDCSTEVLLRRFSETRRRHPLAPAETVLAGVEREHDLLAPVRARADFLIDTSDLTPHDLRAEIGRWFGSESTPGLAVSLQSFSYKRGLPRGMDMVFDCRFLRNPYWEPELRDRDGRDPEVAAYVGGDPRGAPFFEKVHDLALLLLPAYVEEGKTHLAIAFGCTGGRHRSVAMSERLAAALRAAGWQVSLRHRELERRAREGTA
jgi:UPF0042 nucleotide-binding protein